MNDLFVDEAAKPKRPRARVMTPQEVESTTATAIAIDLNAPPTALAVIAEPARGNIVLLDREKFEPFYEDVAEKARAFVPDMTTAKGREALKSFVFQDIVKVRTSLEKQANVLTEEWRRNTSTVVQARKEIESRFKELEAETRKPLTEWEDAEEVRVAACKTAIAKLKAAIIISDADTSESVRARGEVAYDTVLDPDQFGDMLADAESARQEATEALARAFNRLKKAEDDAARLAALEAAEAERVAKAEAEAAERQAREDAERDAAAQAEAEAEEERRVIAARQAELATIEEGKRVAAEEAAQAERNRLTAEREAEMLAEQKRHATELAAAREEAAAAKRAQEQETARLAEIQRQRDAADAVERDRVAAEQAAQKAKDEDLAHKKKVLGLIKAALIEHGEIDEKQARAIALALANKMIPQTTVVW